MGYYVYVLESQSSGRRYVGHTKDVDHRVWWHNAGHNVSTRKRGPWRIVLSEELRTRAEAMKRERFLKTGRGRKELAAILKPR